MQNFFTFTSSPAFTAATYITDDLGTSLEYSISIFSWYGTGPSAYQFKDPQTFNYQVDKSQPSNVTIPYVAYMASEGLIASGPHLLRFNGQQWLSNDNLQITLPWSTKRPSNSRLATTWP